MPRDYLIISNEYKSNVNHCYRYYAILKPLNVTWEARVRKVLAIAWFCAGLASLPQSFIFHLEEHPDVKGYVFD